MNNLKLTVLGSTGTGKTSIITRYIFNEFHDSYDPTIEDQYRKASDCDGENYMLDIVDTSGSEKYLAMRDLFIRTSNAFILVYSITSRVSFEELENSVVLITQAKESTLSSIPVVLIGNKSDLESHRSVSSDEATAFCKKWGISDFMETSAKVEMNVQNVFDSVMKQAKILRKTTSKRQKNFIKRLASKKYANCFLM